MFTRAPASGVDAAGADLLNVAPVFRYAASSTHRRWRRGRAGEIDTLIVTDHANGSGVASLTAHPAAALP